MLKTKSLRKQELESNQVIKPSLFGTFPREISFNRTWCPNIETFKEYLNENNGKSKCSITVYQFTLRNSQKQYGSAIKDSAIIDKVYNDLDGTYSYECYKILRDWLLKENIVFRVNLSGRKAKHDKRAITIYDPEHCIGYHFYIFIKDNLKYHAFSLRNVHEYINQMLIEKLNNKYGIKIHKRIYKKIKKNGKMVTVLVPEEELPLGYIYSPIDSTIFGDVSRMSTPTNTYNVKRESFCVPLTIKDLFLSGVELGKLTYKQRVGLEDIYIGNKLWEVPLDIQEKDFQLFQFDDDELELFEVNTEIIDNPAYPKCIKYILSQEHPDYNSRFWLIVYLREYGEPEEYVKNLLKLYIDKRTIKHILMNEKTIQYVYRGSQKHRKMINCDNFRRILGFHPVMCQDCPRLKYNNAIYF